MTRWVKHIALFSGYKTLVMSERMCGRVIGRLRCNSVLSAVYRHLQRVECGGNNRKVGRRRRYSYISPYLPTLTARFKFFRNWSRTRRGFKARIDITILGMPYGWASVSLRKAARASRRRFDGVLLAYYCFSCNKKLTSFSYFGNTSDYR